MGAFAGFIDAGQKLFGTGNGNRNKPDIEDETELQYAEIQAERHIFTKEKEQLEAEDAELSAKIAHEQEEGNTTTAKARIDYKIGWFGIFLATPLILTCILLAFYSIAPAFYGREHIAYLVCGGCGIAIAIAGHVLLEYLKSTLNKSQAKKFIIYTSLLMLCLGLGGSILLGKARSLQWELQSHLNSGSALEVQANEQEAPVNIEEIKREIEKMTSRALIIWFLALDWMSAILLHLGLNRIRQNKMLAMLSRKQKKVKKAIRQLERRLAHLESITKEDIASSMKVGFARANRRGSPAILALVTIVFLASILGFLILSETKAFGAEQNTHALIALDITSSVTREREESYRAILRIIDSLRPGDSMDVLLITEKTFTNPEYLMSAEMPSRAGYFQEEVIKAKKRLIQEFRKKASGLSESRCRTSLLDGLFLFAELVKEHPAERKVLVILSDMQQTAEGINPDKLARDGDKILGRLKADGLIPDMRGIEVYVLGVSTHGINLRAWAKLKAFWQKYFAATGCELKSYAVGRTFNR